MHVASWAKRFLFDSGQLDRPISSLSGGEQARVLIARLMLQPADVLLLDEPTNDLDIPTLEVLEDSLTEFPGALVLVTHDRYLLDRVSTAVLGLDGMGGAQLFADYWQWEQAKVEPPKAPKKEAAAIAAPPATKKKLSYLEAREWEQDGRRAFWRPSTSARRSTRKCTPPKWSPTALACNPATPAFRRPTPPSTPSMPAGRNWKPSNSRADDRLLSSAYRAQLAWPVHAQTP